MRAGLAGLSLDCSHSIRREFSTISLSHKSKRSFNRLLICLTDPFSDVLRTPVTGESLASLRTKIEQVAALDTPDRYCFQKIANAAEKAFTDRTILLDENRLLFEQNNEKTTQQSARSTMVGNARIMTYDDIDHAERKRAAKETTEPGAKRGSRRPQNSKPHER